MAATQNKSGELGTVAHTVSPVELQRTGQKEGKAMNPRLLEKERYELVDTKVHAASLLLTAGRTQEALDTLLTASFWLRRLKEIDELAKKETP